MYTLKRLEDPGNYLHTHALVCPCKKLQLWINSLTLGRGQLTISQTPHRLETPCLDQHQVVFCGKTSRDTHIIRHSLFQIRITILSNVENVGIDWSDRQSCSDTDHAKGNTRYPKSPVEYAHTHTTYNTSVIDLSLLTALIWSQLDQQTSSQCQTQWSLL